MAKKVFSKVLPVLLALCIFMSTTAFAATTYYIDVTITGPDENGVTQTLTGTSSKYGSLSSMLAYEVVQVINSELDTIKECFARTGFSQIVYDGLEAFSEGEEAWEAYSDIYYEAVTGDFKDTLRDLDSTFADLTLNEVNEITYQPENGEEYVVTVTLRKYNSNTGGKYSREDEEEPSSGDDENLPGDDENLPGDDGPCDGGEDCPAAYLTDLDLELWYHPGICYCVRNGLMVGHAGEVFGPDEALTRAQVAQMLYNIEKNPVVEAKKVFDDVDSSKWYANAIVWASDADVVLGYGNGNFGPEDPVTREQFTAMLYRYSEYKGYDVSADENVDFLVFTDAKTVSDWALNAIKWAYATDIVEGLGDGRLDPVGYTTRAQAATMFMRYCMNIG